MSAEPIDGFVDYEGVEHLTTLSGKHIDRLEREGKFPKRVKLGRRSTWVRAEVLQWVKERADARFAPTPNPSQYDRDRTGRFAKKDDESGRTQPRKQTQSSGTSLMPHRLWNDNTSQAAG